MRIFVSRSEYFNIITTGVGIEVCCFQQVKKKAKTFDKPINKENQQAENLGRSQIISQPGVFN